MNRSPIIAASELLAIYKTNNIVLIDASNGKNAKLNYQEKHLKGALFVDLDTQLADIKEDFSNGGRHPLPSVKEFAKKFTALGIANESEVVVYDDNNGSNAAARLWWMLTSAGHEKVQVLNGGLKEALKIGFPTSNEIEQPNHLNPCKVKKCLLPISNTITQYKIVQ